MEKVNPAATNPLALGDVGIFDARSANENPFHAVGQLASKQVATGRENEDEREKRFQASLLVQIICDDRRRVQWRKGPGKHRWQRKRRQEVFPRHRQPPRSKSSPSI